MYTVCNNALLPCLADPSWLLDSRLNHFAISFRLTPAWMVSLVLSAYSLDSPKLKLYRM